MVEANHDGEGGESAFKAELTRVAGLIATTQGKILAERRIIGTERLVDAMAYAIAGGKCLRGYLLVASASLFGVELGYSLRVASALEFMHGYSLIHDDLPAMDDDMVRRGRPTLHIAFDEATAILAGDGLQSLAYEVVAGSATHESGLVRAMLVSELAVASGIEGMVGGQVIDMEAEGRELEIGEVERLQMLKTGALFIFACEGGAILGGAGDEARASLREYGRLMGRMFQIVDDLIDLEGDVLSAGKAVGKDAVRGKATYVGLAGACASRAKVRELYEGALQSLAGFDESAVGPLYAAATFGARRRA